MAQPVSISLHKFTSSVQAAVKAAVAKHPKFKVPVPSAISVGYLIRGFPVPDEILAQVTLGETQAFVADVAAHLGQAQPEAIAIPRQPAQSGAILSVGRHIICGIPVTPEMVQIEA